jgi:hypothetical protein
MRINNFIKTLICFSLVLCLYFVFAKESKITKKNIESISKESYPEASLEQKLATEFTQDAIVAIRICREADELFGEAIQDVIDSKRSEDECLSDMYKAKERFIDSRRIVEKWEKKGTIEQIVDEIGDLKFGIEDLSDAFEQLSKIIENIFSDTVGAENIQIKYWQASQKAQAARKRLFGFAARWLLRIHHGENKPFSHHIQLTKRQYSYIKYCINNNFKKEADEFWNSENRDNLSTYTWCYRMFDYAVTEELKKSIEDEAIYLTRYIEEPISTEVNKVEGEVWVISKFSPRNGNSVCVRTRFLEESESYDIQYVIFEGNKNRFEKSENPKKINLDHDKEAFVFSYDQYGEFCCLVNFNKKDKKHDCKVLISKY